MSSRHDSQAPEPDHFAPRGMNAFERYLSVWVVASMALGLLIGKALPGLTSALRRLEFGAGSHINVPVAALIWLMKPFSMAFFGWLFFRHVFSPWIGPELAGQYIAGVIILAAAPCTAMVFVWSYLADGDPAYTLVQVSVNDLVMLIAFAPIVKLLVTGAAGLEVPLRVLLLSVLVFVVVPLALGALSRAVLIARRGAVWFEERFVRAFAPVTTAALLATLVLIFAFQAE